MTENEFNSTLGSGMFDQVFLEQLRLQMLKFATLQLSDSHLAEDAVQEALIGAMKNASSFGGRSALKTWVFAILKNKIADILRQKRRVIPVSNLFKSDEEEEQKLDALFDAKGFWQENERPIGWSDPEQSIRNTDFWQMFEICLNDLPPKQARIFMMREFIELESDEICSSLDISTSNLHVILHRARLQLRECIENKWFLEGDCKC